MKDRIGIYSGIFDPVHHGHLSFARKALHELGLDKVYFMVEPQPRRKTGQSDIRHRLNMMWLALRDQPAMELLDSGHQTFSVGETLPWLEEKFKDAELYLLMGSDRFKKLPGWPGFDSLKNRVKFVVGQRSDDDSQQVPIDHTPVQTVLPELASSQIRTMPVHQLPAAVPAMVSQYIQAQGLYRPAGS